MFSVLSGEVPLVGRSLVLSRIGEALRRDDVYGAFVYGDTGTGKSVLARHLTVGLSGEFVPFLITPAPALGAVPYGALAPFLGSATTADMSSPLSVLRVTLSFLRSTADGRPIVVVLDDAHLLDDDSSHLLAQLVSSRTIMLIAFSRSTTSRSEELVSLCRDDLLERFDLEALDHAEARTLCSLVLGGDIVRGSSDRLCDESSGNPLFLKAMLDEALARGNLVKRDGVWALVDQELALPISLVDLVRVAIAHLPDDERKAFEVIALGERVPFAGLTRISSESAVSTLLQEGLIRDDPVDPAFAVGQHPIYGRALRTLIPVGRSTALHHELAGVAVSLPSNARSRIRDGIWSLDCGERLDDERLLELAGLALRLLDPVAALRFGDAVRAEPLMTTARVHRASALFELSRLKESRDLVADMLEDGETPEQVTAAGVLEVRLLLACGQDVAHVDEILDRWASALKRLTDDEAVQGREQCWIVVRAFGWNLLGRYGDTVEALQTLLKQGSSDFRVVVLAHALLAEALGALGRGLQGRQYSATALTLIESNPEILLDLHRVAFFRHVSLLVHAGDFEAAEAELRDYAPEEGRDYAFVSGSLAVLDAATDVRRGRFRAGLGKLRPALAGLRMSDSDALLPYALGITAWAAAAVGEDAMASDCLTEMSRTGPRGSRQFGLLAMAFAAAARALTSTGSDEAEKLLEYAAVARSGNWASCEKDILELAASVGRSDAAELLKNVTDSLEGAEASVLNAYARALLARDAAALAAAGDRAELFQKYLLAAEACRQAMEVYAGAGDARSQRALAPVIRRRRALVDGGVFLEPTELDGVPPLTSREREIATLALQGHSNRDIARILTVSTRTVEGHLYRIYVKLGISRREDLTSELESRLGS